MVCRDTHESQRNIHKQILSHFEIEHEGLRRFSVLIFVIPTEMKSSHLYVLFPFRHSGRYNIDNLSLLVDPVELGGLPGDDLTLLEPESNLLLGVLDGVGAVADVAADIDGVVTTDGTGGRGKGVGGTEDG